MKPTHILVSYLTLFFAVFVNIPHGCAADEYSAYEPKHEYHHHEYHGPPAKKAANVDINIPFDFGTIAKLGILGLTQLKLLMALGKVAGAGLGVGALGLGQLSKLGLKISTGHGHHHHGHHKGGGIAIDVGGPHQHHYESKSHSEYDHHHEKHY